MSKKQPWEIAEQMSENGPDIETVQGQAMGLVAEWLAMVLRDLLDQGVLVREDGMILVNRESELAGE